MTDTKPGITCRKCLGRIDELAFEWKRKLHAKSAKPYTPPALCSDCAAQALLTLAYQGDDELSDELDVDSGNRHGGGWHP